MALLEAKSWSSPGALLDALRDTRRVVAAVELPFAGERTDRGERLIRDILEQLDQHIIPRAEEGAAPAIAVVAGSTGSGKSTLVNSLMGKASSEAGVLRPTTRTPQVFHHPADDELLSSVVRRAALHSTDEAPRGLVVVDSPDIDSLEDANRDVARELLDAADLWVFVTTAARYGDALPWDMLRAGAQRGASIALVLNRVTVDATAHVKRDLVDRLRAEGLESLPLFIISEEAGPVTLLPGPAIHPLKVWLHTIAPTATTMVVERTLHGAVQALKEWLEELADLVEAQADDVKNVRADVRRSVARAQHDAGEQWYRDIVDGPVSTSWARATQAGGPLFKIRTGAWAKRRSARDDRDAALDQIRVELRRAVEDALVYSAATSSDKVADALVAAQAIGEWIDERRTPEDAHAERTRHASDAAIRWFEQVEAMALAHPAAPDAVAIVGEQGLGTVFASAALGSAAARQVLTLLLGPGLQERFDEARELLGVARRYCVNREALDVIRPTDRRQLLAEAAAAVRLRRAELRSLL